MGADIHITVGRVATKMLPRPMEQATGTALAVFDNRKIRFGDFEFTDDLPKEADINRCYALFAFLANVRGSVKPIMELDELMAATDQFLTWLNNEHTKRLDAPKGCYQKDFIGDYAEYDVGDWGRVFYPIQVLRAFDYDQVALVEDEGLEDPNSSAVYFLDKDGQTYRDMFDETYFNFLDWCLRENWQFAIFGFDN
jgi:hypothetical protein